jgi:hypothetical protein
MRRMGTRLHRLISLLYPHYPAPLLFQESPWVVSFSTRTINLPNLP